MLEGLEGWHIILIVGVAVVLFGSGKLPGAARSMGQSLRIFKSEMKAAVKDEDPPGALVSPVVAASPVVASPVVAASPVTVSPAVAEPELLEGRIVTETVVAEPVPQNVPTQP
jgi:sec-independent protein translocase protein TatA